MPALRALVLSVGLAIAALVTTPPAQAAPRAALDASPAPGDPIFSDLGACVVGAYVRDSRTNYILTAAECGQFGDTWYADAGHTILVGTTAGGGGLIALAPGVTPVHAFNGTGNAFVGENVCALTPGTGSACGQVTAVNLTIQTETGAITNVISATTCTPDPADLGAPLVSGDTLIGIEFANGCIVNGPYFQPITRILASFGLTLL